ncbi:hypothetical protein CDAR_376181 [Caerostris darwini]|uniref:Uncharacterized protein n=1 Tax=Caerostris darwini TaxID=1538125 RepID=A0AAV4VCC8_9ARAC|nr:hypothetical protein CDAR_376181 [Caerostris darwini]
MIDLQSANSFGDQRSGEKTAELSHLTFEGFHFKLRWHSVGESQLAPCGTSEFPVSVWVTQSVKDEHALTWAKEDKGKYCKGEKCFT